MKKVLVLLVFIVCSSSTVNALPISEIILHEVKGVVYSEFYGDITSWGLDESPGKITLDGWLFGNWDIKKNINDPKSHVFTGVLDFNFKAYELIGLDVGKWDFCFVSNKAKVPQAPVPEPATLFLFGSGILTLWSSRKKIGVKA